MVTPYRTLTPEESAFFNCHDVHKIRATNYAKSGDEAGMEEEISALMNVYSFVGREMPVGEIIFIRSRLSKTQH